MSGPSLVLSFEGGLDNIYGCEPHTHETSGHTKAEEGVSTVRIWLIARTHYDAAR